MREDSRLRGVEAGLPAIFREQRKTVGRKRQEILRKNWRVLCIFAKMGGKAILPVEIYMEKRYNNMVV